MEDLQKEALEELYLKQGAFEELIRVRGWEYIKAYVENNVRTFSTKAIKKGFKDEKELEYERGVVNGMLRLVEQVNETLEQAKREKEKDGSVTN